MRAHCCICSDQFENDATVDIAAVQCGHTFHDECLMKWLKSSNTCPSCRTAVTRQKIIHRLYFDGGEVDDEEQDNSKLTNEIQDLKLQLLQKDKDKTDLLEGKKSLEKKHKDAEKKRKEVENLYKQEQTTNCSLSKQLQYFQSQQEAVTAEREECRRIKRKLVELQNVEKLLTGTESEAQDIMSRAGDSEGSSKEIARYCGMLKREYDQVKQDKKATKAELDKLRRNYIAKDRDLQEKTEQAAMLREVYRKSEEDLKNVEKERDLLRKKVSRLKHAIKSPSNNEACSESFIQTLGEPSPMMTVNATNTPTPTTAIFSNLDDSSASFDDKDHKVLVPCTPEVVKPSPNTQNKQHCQQNSIKYVRISSAADNSNPAKKQKRDIQDISNVPALSSYNIFKKKTGISDYSSNHRKGYDGLGAHTTFTQSQRKPTLLKSKSVSRITSKAGKMSKMPALPRLDQYIDLS